MIYNTWRKKPVLYFTTVLLIFFFSIECAGYLLAGHSRPALSLASAGSRGTAGRNNSSLKKKLAALQPKGIYIVVDTGRNLLYMKNREEVIRKAIISSGSGNVLVDPNGERTWTFDTPRGEHSIKSKIVDPDWIKPDWAFVEEGKAVPDKFNDRVESGVLGKYALAIGNGYLLHGTLYTRMLGRNVTHGCVRVGDKDLEFLYKNTPIGAKVIIF